MSVVGQRFKDRTSKGARLQYEWEITCDPLWSPELRLWFVWCDPVGAYAKLRRPAPCHVRDLPDPIRSEAENLCGTEAQ